METDFRGLQERLRQRLLDEIAAGELTGLQLARETGFRQAHIWNFLNRRRGLSLQAMDEIMRARKLTLAILQAGGGKAKEQRWALQANSAETSWIPVVDEENCLASDVPFSLERDTLRVMSRRLERVRPKVLIPRPHWQRFVAVRVRGEDAEAMGPRLKRGALAVIDRHSNEIEQAAIYAVRVSAEDASRDALPHSTNGRLNGTSREQLVLRYVERLKRDLVLRAENVSVRLAVLEDTGSIVGRVRMVIEEI